MKYNQWDRYEVIRKYLSKEERETCEARTEDFFKNEIAPPLKLSNYRGQALAAIKRKEKATNEKV
jgi:hypothetical protein